MEPTRDRLPDARRPGAKLCTIRRIGKREFAKIATDFVKQDSHNLSARMLRARLTAYGMTV